MSVVSDPGRGSPGTSSNAIKYSPEGGVVRVDVAVDHGFVRAAVADEGLRIPTAAQAHRASAKFFRRRPPGPARRASAALGLALAREINAAHGGEIGLLESVDGNGIHVLVHAAGRALGRFAARFAGAVAASLEAVPMVNDGWKF